MGATLPTDPPVPEKVVLVNGMTKRDSNRKNEGFSDHLIRPRIGITKLNPSPSRLTWAHRFGSNP
jgi:hypothetical protein